MVPLEEATERLGRAWGIVNHLNNVADTPELRAAYNENQPKVTEFWTALAQNEALFAKYKAIARQPGLRNAVAGAQEDRRKRAARLPPRRRRTAGREEGALRRDPGTARRRVHPLLRERAGRDQRLQAAGRQTRPTWPACRTTCKQAARAAAEKDGKAGYQFTLHFPSYFPMLQFADKRELRETIYRASATKASEMGTVFSELEKWDNTRQHRHAAQAAQRGSASCSTTATSPKCRWCRRWRKAPST